MSELPAISVAIPCHNYGAFLDEAYASVAGQDVDVLDVSIVDDGSTDDSLARAQQIAAGDPRVRVVHNATPVGAPRCFNMSVDATRGDLVVILSADDRMAPGYLRSLASAIVANGWDFAYPDVRLFGAEDHFVPAQPFVPVRLLVRNYITGSTMFRRAAFDAVGGFDERLGALGHEDWDFWLNVVGRGFVGGPVHDATLEWRRHVAGSRNTESLRRRWRVHAAMVRRHHAVAPFGTKVRYVAGALRRRVSRPPAA